MLIICNASEKGRFQKTFLTMLLFFYTKSVLDAYSIYTGKFLKQQHICHGDIWDVGEQVKLRPSQLSRGVASSKLAAWSLECVL